MPEANSTAKEVETFLVKFEVNGRKWEERLPRPIRDRDIEAAARRHTRRRIHTDLRGGDYGGDMHVNGVIVGRYFIVPGSSRLERRS